MKILINSRLVGISILFVVILSCCNRGGKTEDCVSISLTDFEEINLGDSVLLKYPYRIHVCDSMLLMLDLHAPQGYFLHLFTYPEFQYQKSLLREGRGPGEFITLSAFDVYDDSLYVMNPHTKVLHSYSLKDLQQEDNPVPHFTIYDIGPFPILNYRKTADGMLFVENSKVRRLIHTRPEKESTEILLHSPDSNNSVPTEYNVSLWNSFLAHDEKYRLTAVVTQLGEMLEIVKDENVKEIVGEGGFPDILPIGNGFSLGKVDGYYDVQIVDDHIYALYSGMDMARERTTQGANKLRMYNLNGDLVACFHLSHYATGFDLDTKTQRLILLDVNSENQIIVYNASPVLELIH